MFILRHSYYYILSLIFSILILSAICITADYKLADYGLNDVSGTLAAIGDFDSDKEADLFIVRYDENELLYLVDLYRYTNKPHQRYELYDWVHPVTSIDPIESVILGDFNYDGRLDILITGPNTTASNGEYFVKIFFADSKQIIAPLPFDLSTNITYPSPIGQVSSLPITGDLYPDLFGMYYDPISSTYGRGIWSFIPITPSSSSSSSSPSSSSSSSSSSTSSSSLSTSSTTPTTTTTSTTTTTTPDPLLTFEIVFKVMPLTISTTNPLLNSTSFPYLSIGFAPILGDFNGDCASDLILVTTNIPPLQQIYPGNQFNGSIPYDPTQIQFDNEKQIEIWILDRSSTDLFPYKLHFTLPAYLGILQPAVGDFDKDGALDLAIPYCYPYSTCYDKNTIEIYYNIQRGLCSTLSLSSSCRSATNLCVADNNWDLDYIGKNSNNPPAPLHSLNIETNSVTQNNDGDHDDDDTHDDDDIIPQPQLYFNHSILTTSTTLFNLDNQQIIFSLPSPNQRLSLLNLPFRLTVADINSDGDLDFVFVATYPSSSNNNNNNNNITQTFFFTLTTTECKKETCFSNQITNRLYTFLSLRDPTLESISTSAFAIGLIDFANSGSLDLLVLKLSNNNDENNNNNNNDHYGKQLNSVGILSLQNNFHDDTYFLTLLGGNGMCHSWCNGLQFPDPKPYGVSQSGLVFKFTVTALSGTKSPRIFIQQIQTAYSPLTPPYLLVGLGRTSNYIEELFLGLPTTIQYSGPDNSNLFQAMIPNSQIVVFPYPINSPINWRLELFISPTQRLLAVFIAFIVTTVACSIVILILHLREKFAEEKLKKQRQRLFAF